MTVQTKTTYVCDSCLSVVEGPKDLRRFTLTETKLSGPSEVVAQAKTDLCTDCERRLHEAALGFFPGKEAEKLHGIVRG